MVMEERRDSIVDLVNAAGSISFAHLKREFPNVSEMTLRTDLKVLDEARRIVRVHGGAKSVSFAVGTDDLFARRVTRNASSKSAIARKAAQLLVPDTVVFIDSGSTTTALAQVMPDIHLLVFTNSLTVATELARLERVETMLVGGKLNQHSMCTSGGAAIEAVQALSFDQVYLGVTGYERGRGFSCGLDDQAVFKRAVLSASDEKIVLMDAGKEGRHSTFPICGLAGVDTIVTEEGVSPDFLADCAAASLAVLM